MIEDYKLSLSYCGILLSKSGRNTDSHPVLSAMANISILTLTLSPFFAKAQENPNN